MASSLTNLYFSNEGSPERPPSPYRAKQQARAVRYADDSLYPCFRVFESAGSDYATETRDDSGASPGSATYGLPVWIGFRAGCARSHNPARLISICALSCGA